MIEQSYELHRGTLEFIAMDTEVEKCWDVCDLNDMHGQWNEKHSNDKHKRGPHGPQSECRRFHKCDSTQHRHGDHHQT